ncbi:MAG TPA: PilZ domain-containing protein [Candidatus Saccharimonadales bacterium]|jgi:hypothetical protein|nr:PilZ domain-containing protein [Candidatus Saccharimonadales bacterium]
MQRPSALLLSNDTAVLRDSQRILSGYNFIVRTVATASAAAGLISSGQFDLAVYDGEIPGAIDLASQTGPGAPGVVFAILDGRHPAMIAGKRIHFSLPKPLPSALFARSMKAAYGMVMRKRPAFRYEVQIVPSSAALLYEGETRQLGRITILNLSQTGLGLAAQGMLPPGATLQIDFMLPKCEVRIRVTGSVVWSHESGRAGVSIQRIPAEERYELQKWLDAMPSPESVLLPETRTQQPATGH